MPAPLAKLWCPVALMIFESEFRMSSIFGFCIVWSRGHDLMASLK